MYPVTPPEPTPTPIHDMWAELLPELKTLRPDIMDKQAAMQMILNVLGYSDMKLAIDNLTVVGVRKYWADHKAEIEPTEPIPSQAAQPPEPPKTTAGNGREPSANTTTALATTIQSSALATVSPEMARFEVMRQEAAVLLKSGFLPQSIKTPEQAITIMMMGDALGIKPIVALNSINVIAGKPTVSPQLMLALVRRSGQLETIEITDDGNACTVKMKRRSEPVYVSVFSMDDARRLKTTEYDNGVKKTIALAEKYNWVQQPATMRKWRAVAAACRVVFPDCLWGIASYTPEEISPDIVIESAGEIVDEAA
jgi:hypothetical protein